MKKKKKSLILLAKGQFLFFFFLKRSVEVLAQTLKMSVLRCDYHQQMSPALPLGRLTAKFFFVFNEPNSLLISVY